MLCLFQSCARLVMGYISDSASNHSDASYYDKNAIKRDISYKELY